MASPVFYCSSIIDSTIFLVGEPPIARSEYLDSYA
jgi:hypothetical protein